MTDLFNPQDPPQFKDIPKQQDRAAEEKAMLCLKLKNLILKAPDSVRSGSVNITRRWLKDQSKARKVLEKTTSSRNELQREINIMEQY